MSDRTRVLIVDDEPLARGHIRRLLGNDPDIIVIGECSDGAQAVKAIVELAPDLVLLDIQMPEMSGFDVLSAVGADSMPSVIFVTAFDEFALKAFDVNAIDYVLKPVDQERLLTAVSRARSRLAGRESRRDALDRVIALALEERAGRASGRILLKVDGRHVFVPLASVGWLEAVDDYVRFHLGKVSYLVRATLSSFEEQLPPTFLRVHRSVIVNTENLLEIQTTEQGDYRLLMNDGIRLPTGRSYRAAVAAVVRSFTPVSR